MSGKISSASAGVRCFAKINLQLAVHGKREDGFHQISTVFQSIDLHDILCIGLEPGGRDLELTCDRPGLPAGEENLASRAARQFLLHSGIRASVRMRLQKRIPVAAGLGGGSSDAAAVLRLLNEMAQHPLTPDQLGELAAGLGSDVPYFLHGGTARGSGRGEIIEPLADLQRMALLLLVPDFGVSAAFAYSRIELTSATPSSNIYPLSGDGEGTGSGTPWSNDLERGVFAHYPVLGRLKSWLIGTGALDAVMSGSGPVLVGRFENLASAAAAGENLSEPGVGAIVCGSLTREQFHRRNAASC